MALRHLLVAVQFLTRLPVPRLAEHRRDDLARAAPWFPAAGLLVGACTTLACLAGTYAGPWVAAWFGLVAWVVVTGALHLDGLADLTDAAAAAHGDRTRFLNVLKDPHIGAFGVVALVLQLAAKLVLLHELAARDAPWFLVAIPAAARLGPLVWSRTLPALGVGLGERSAGSVRGWHLAAWSIAILACAPSAPWLLGTWPLIAAWQLYLKRRVGGVTGDCHGAGIELVETGLLILAVTSSAL